MRIDLQEASPVMGLDNPIHIAFLLILLLLVFGAKRLPEMGKSLGSGMRGFKDALSGEAESHHQEAAVVAPALAVAPQQEAPIAPAVAVAPAVVAQPQQAAPQTIVREKLPA
jgi:sec-independent protein translocase protein TatA